MLRRNANPDQNLLTHNSRTRLLLASFVACFAAIVCACSFLEQRPAILTNVSTLAGVDGQISEPFGIAVNEGMTYVSDGEGGKIWLISTDGTATVFVSGLETPSAIAFDKNGDLLVADSGGNVIKKVDKAGTISLVAGVEGEAGFADGDSATALFNAPVGIAIGEDGKIFVSDTYNDRIRVIENGKVTTLAGGDTGFADGVGISAKFDTPCGIAIWNGKLLVADSNNRRIRVIEPDGITWTLAGSGTSDLLNGSSLSSAFIQPTAIAVDATNSIFVTDGNAIRRLGGNVLPIVTTVSSGKRGILDGKLLVSKFNRPSGIAFDDTGNLIVADSENRLVRKISAGSGGHEITTGEIAARRDKPEEFRKIETARWPFDPPTAIRDIAGTLGEVRGEIMDGSDDVWFHNGLDVAGAYGETARFVRSEKVLKTTAAENFGTLRELIRMPTIGYIHIRLGRDSNASLFDDPRFQFQKDAVGKIVNVRVPRGAKFATGDRIGTLNSMNHVHLIAGRTGFEMNALDALILPGISDTREPVIEKVSLTDKNWDEIETVTANSRIKLRDPIRIIVRAYDQVDRNSERRRLGIYMVNYRIIRGDAPMSIDPAAQIKFNLMPPNEAVKFVYAHKSHSGATGETIFNYIATNSVEGENYKEGFLDPSEFENGIYILRISVADYFGNTATQDISIEVIK